MLLIVLFETPLDPPRSAPFPTRRSSDLSPREERRAARRRETCFEPAMTRLNLLLVAVLTACALGLVTSRSEEHTSELQSLTNLVCRLLLEKKKGSSASARSAMFLLCSSA